MAFLDWIKNGNAAPQQSVANKFQEQKPETAKEMYSRQDAQERAAAKPIPPEAKTQADHAMRGVREALQNPAPQAAAPENSGSPQRNYKSRITRIRRRTH